jgi:hypothetical protein
MANSVEFDKGQLEGAISNMASAYQPLAAKFDEVLKAPEELTPAWKCSEGTAVINQFATITNGVANFKSAYGSLTGFLSSSVSVNYNAIEEELAAALAGQNTGGN